MSVRYRAAVETAWRIGHPLLRINPDWIAGGAPQSPVDSFAGSLFDLVPGTAYDVEITLEEPGRDPQTLIQRVTTRALPGAAPAATKTASASGGSLDPLWGGPLHCFRNIVEGRTRPRVGAVRP